MDTKEILERVRTIDRALRLARHVDVDLQAHPQIRQAQALLGELEEELEAELASEEGA